MHWCMVVFLQLSITIILQLYLILAEHDKLTEMLAQNHTAPALNSMVSFLSRDVVGLGRINKFNFINYLKIDRYTSRFKSRDRNYVPNHVRQVKKYFFANTTKIFGRN